MNKRLQGLMDFYQKDPKDPFILYGLAIEYKSENQSRKSEDFFQLLLQQDPEYVAGYIQYAQLMEKEDRIKEAKELYKRGIEEEIRTGDKISAKEMEDFLSGIE